MQSVVSFQAVVKLPGNITSAVMKSVGAEKNPEILKNVAHCAYGPFTHLRPSCMHKTSELFKTACVP